MPEVRGYGIVGMKISEEQRKKAAASETGCLLLLGLIAALFFLSMVEYYLASIGLRDRIGLALINARASWRRWRPRNARW